MYFKLKLVYSDSTLSSSKCPALVAPIMRYNVCFILVPLCSEGLMAAIPIIPNVLSAQ